MKLLVTILIISITSCAAQMHRPLFQQRARLVEVVMQDRSRAKLTLLTTNKDTVKMLFGSSGVIMPHWQIDSWYTITCDSSDYKVIEGKRYYQAKLKRSR
jgi:hypothetical protein